MQSRGLKPKPRLCLLSLPPVASKGQKMEKFSQNIMIWQRSGQAVEYKYGKHIQTL